MKNRRVKIGVIIALIGAFFMLSSYLFIQELNFYLDEEGKSPNYGLVDFNWFVIGLGMFFFIIGTGYTIFSFILDQGVNKTSKNQEHIHN